MASRIPQDAQIDQYQSWVVESDTITNLNQIKDGEDIENDYTPFINPKDLTPKDNTIIEGQAEIFIGKKTDLAQWNSKTADTSPHVDLDIMSK